MFTGISAHSLTKRLTGHVPKKGGINEISTHSLTKRLTGSHKRHHWNYRHFNSQPHEEADPLSLPLWLSQYYFNSQPHEEADRTFSCRVVFGHISTHSLTKRLTSPIASSSNSTANFNSQPHEEADRKGQRLRGREQTFQLTASRRGWLAHPERLSAFMTFQLTASRRGWRYFYGKK